MAWIDAAIETDRLTLRPLSDEDRDVVRRLLTCPDTRRFLGGPVSDDEVERRLQRPLMDEWGHLAITESPADVVLGTVMLHRDRGVLEVSWQLLPEHRGLGYATEAVAALLEWVWNNLDEDEVVAVTQAANAPSTELAHRLGMTQARVLQEFGEMQLEFRVTNPALVTA